MWLWQIASLHSPSLELTLSSDRDKPSPQMIYRMAKSSWSAYPCSEAESKQLMTALDKTLAAQYLRPFNGPFVWAVCSGKLLGGAVAQRREKPCLTRTQVFTQNLPA